MRRARVVTCVSVAVALLLFSAQPLEAAENAKDIAVLHWYLADQAASLSEGSFPQGIAFDGASIWVTNKLNGTVTKLLVSDGEVLGTFSAGSEPQAIAFDGVNIWVTNESSSTVTRLRASDGACVSPCTFNVGHRPEGMAFDGTNIWVTNAVDGTVTELQASNGAVLGTFSVGSFPFGVAFDGTSIWVANNGSNTVTKLNPKTGSTLGTFPAGNGPTQLAFDGTNIWVTDDVNITGQTTPVVVGQQIALTGVIPSPQNSCVSSQTWPLPAGTAIANYSNGAGGPPDTTGGKVTNLAAGNTSNYTFYWIAPGNSLQVKYQYTLTNRAQSPAATAFFNVTAPTQLNVTVQPVSPVDVELEIGSPSLEPGWYAHSIAGINFTESETPPNGSGSNNAVEWLQLILGETHQLLTKTNVNGCGGGPICNCSPANWAPPELDNNYPYVAAVPPTFTNDTPGVLLGASMQESEHQRSFSAPCICFGILACPARLVPRQEL
jgi:YVTN family beta-propeller protein